MPASHAACNIGIASIGVNAGHDGRARQRKGHRRRAVSSHSASAAIHRARMDFNSSLALQAAEKEAVGIRGGRRQRDGLAVRGERLRRFLAEQLFPRAQGFHHLEVRILRGKAVHLRFVLVRQDRAGHIEQRAAWADELASLRQGFLLLAGALVEILLRQPPLRIGSPPPGARAGAWRIDQNLVELAAQGKQTAALIMDLDITGSSPLQPLDDRRQPPPVAVIGVNLTLVMHGGRHGKRLAAAAGAIVEHLIALFGQDEIGDDLRAFVLNLEPALLEGKFCGDVRQAGCAFAGWNADAATGNLRCLRACTLQRLHDLGAVGLQRVCAKVERRTFGKSLRFGKPAVTECALEGGFDPFRDVALDMKGRVFELAGRKGSQRLGARCLGREFVAVEFCGESLGRKAPLAKEYGMGQCRGAVVFHQPGMGKSHAQCVVDDIADRGPVAGTGEAMGKAPILQGVSHRSLARFYIGKNFDGPLQSAAQTHSLLSCLRMARSLVGSSGDLRPVKTADTSPIRSNIAHGGRLLRCLNRVVAAIDRESKRHADLPGLCGDRRLLRCDDFVADLGRSGGDHADVLSGGTGEIENAPVNEGSAVVDANDDAATIMLVGDPQTRAESKRAMGGSKISGTHTFPGSSLGASSVP
ncbi:hypothetical protein RHSP_66447 [Rhizobium freirei PRF 81]|uniref:Uncharacterized protein n=1 Tax=Rhizobium freirei PRF 81 TaxID=363754 RepID=N6V8C0_9HYPH|nr:hypothetical protein RHSP_66447 [Rhizobium freirei PRF 81]